MYRNHSHLQSIYSANKGLEVPFSKWHLLYYGSSTTQAFQMTFQISRNQFQSNSQNFHPGIDVYFQSQHERDRIRIATELQSPLLLKNKKARRVMLQKKVAVETQWALVYFNSSLDHHGYKPARRLWPLARRGASCR